MRPYILLPLLLIGALTACSPEDTSTPELMIDSHEELQAHLQSHGRVSDAGTVSQPFFWPEGKILVYNNAAIQIFEYPDEEGAAEEAILIEPDGSAVGATQLSWVDPPHFYRSGRLIVLFVGKDEGTMRILEEALGEQIAGQ